MIHTSQASIVAKYSDYLPKIDLLIRPAYKAGKEDWYGYLRRLHEANGQPPWKYVLTDDVTSTRGTKMNDRYACRHALLGRKDSGALEYRFGSAFIKDLIDDHHTLYAPIASRFICPYCLSTQGYHHRLWRHDWLCICPKHCCGLLSRCPQCLDPLTWATSHSMRCNKCDFDLRTATSKPVEHEVTFMFCHLLSSQCNLCPQPQQLCHLPMLDTLTREELDKVKKFFKRTIDSFSEPHDIRRIDKNWVSSTARTQKSLSELAKSIQTWPDKAIEKILTMCLADH